MDNFVVSARKYRPVGFEEVVGQEHITTTLKNAIDSQHLAQALLFCGPRGVGKTTCARIVARLINDQRIDNPLMENDTFNIYELDAASNNSVDDIRNLIDQVRYPPQQGKFKVYIIDEVHMLSNQAFNAFLKTLEEPPSYAIFILATTEKHKVIPTILSRCQIFDFNRIEVSDISKQLQKIATNEGIEAEQEALDLIAQKADGAMRDALSLFDLIVTFSGKKVSYQATIDNLHILDYDYYFKMTESLLAEKTAEVLLLFDEILKKGFDGNNFIVGLASHFRDLMVCKDQQTISLLTVSDSIKARYNEQAQEVPLSFLLSALNIANQCDLNYKGSKNQRLHVELALLKIAHLNSALSLASMNNASPEASKKKSLTIPDSQQEDQKQVVPKEEPNKEQPSAEEEPQEKTAEIPPPVERVSVRKRTKSKTLSIPTNLSDAQKIVNEPLVYTSSEEKEPEDQQKRNSSFSNEQLKTHLHEIVEEYEQNGQHHEALLLKETVTLDEQLITVKISNEALEGTFDRMRSDLLTRLRDHLNNDHIQIKSEIIEPDKKDMLYTDKEKFEHLKKKYPALKDLQEKFSLDPEF